MYILLPEMVRLEKTRTVLMGKPGMPARLYSQIYVPSAHIPLTHHKG